MTRITDVWGRLDRDRRLAAGAALGLFVALFLPWYRVTVVQLVNGHDGGYLLPANGLRMPTTDLFSGWDVFSVVEASVLIVAIGVLLLLWIRARTPATSAPDVDGLAIVVAGGWVCLMVIWRMFDKQGASRDGQIALSSGIEWGIFVALAVAILLTYAGWRMRGRASSTAATARRSTVGQVVFDGRWEEPGDIPSARRARPSTRSRSRPSESPARTATTPQQQSRPQAERRAETDDRPLEPRPQANADDAPQRSRPQAERRAETGDVTQEPRPSAPPRTETDTTADTPRPQAPPQTETDDAAPRPRPRTTRQTKATTATPKRRPQRKPQADTDDAAQQPRPRTTRQTKTTTATPKPRPQRKPQTKADNTPQRPRPPRKPRSDTDDPSQAASKAADSTASQLALPISAPASESPRPQRGTS